MSTHVTVCGGGLAGLAAALRLAERGYEITLYEQKSMLGGNLASRPADGGYLDVYPHMYLNWYGNFWDLVGSEDRELRFRPMQGVKQLARGEYPKFTGLTEPYSAWRMLQNIFSGVGPPADMLLYSYATVDLLAEDLNKTILLDDVSVNGFLHARPYMTERTAEAYNTYITTVWGIPSYLAAAGDYQDFLSYSFAKPTPAFWLARGSAYEQVIAPLETRLQEHGVEIVRETQVTSVCCTDGRVKHIGLQKAQWDPRTYDWVGAEEPRTQPIDELVLAVPPRALSQLIRAGEPGERIVENAPKLAQISRLGAQNVPLITLFLKRRLPRIPPEPVGLTGSQYGLAFTDLGQTWPGLGNRTVLALSSSDPFGLPGTAPEDDAFAMLKELARYLEIDPGTKWGDSPDVDWERTRYETNMDAQLFLNETGTDVWRPAATVRGVENVFFAGDYCDNLIGMATMESAVTGGLEAASALVERRGGEPVKIRTPKTLPKAFWVWARYAGMPSAAAASLWSKGSDLLGRYL